MFKIFTTICLCISLTLIAFIAVVAIIIAVASPKLPEVSALINYQPKTKLEDGIKKFINWYQEYYAEY